MSNESTSLPLAQNSHDTVSIPSTVTNDAIVRWISANGATSIGNSTITLSDTGIFSLLDSSTYVNAANGYKLGELSFANLDLNNNIYLGGDLLTAYYGTGNTANLATATTNVLLGQSILSTVTTNSSNNVCVGQNIAIMATTGISQNTFIGNNSANIITTGSNNVMIGHNSAQQIMNGVGNICIGENAASSLGNGVSTSVTNNILIGLSAGNNITNATNNVVIGANTNGELGSANSIIIGEGATSNGLSTVLSLGNSLFAGQVIKSVVGTATGAIIGNIGVGPTTAAQNSWLQVVIGGTTYYVPLWK